MPSKEEASPKIGAGHAQAMFRLGLKELREIASFHGSNIQQPGEYGLYGTRTPGEVAEAREISGKDLEEEKSVLAERMREAESREDHERDCRDLDKE